MGCRGVPDGSAQAADRLLDRLPLVRRGRDMGRQGRVEGRIAPDRALMGGQQAAERRPNGSKPG